MIGKLVLLPFRLITSVSGLAIGILKLASTFSFGIMKVLFKNSIGLLIGLVAGVFIVKKQLDNNCCCEGTKKEETIE
ncbi:MAG TPA: hypothetical protein VHO70_19960 [Chitinispirillaceae bacterium]|nr:hypothetical protein [Chitinispirillaceae bacterium]